MLLLAEGLQSFHSPNALHNKWTYVHHLNCITGLFWKICYIRSIRTHRPWESHNLVSLYTSSRNIALWEVTTFDMNITNRTTFQTKSIPRNFRIIPFSVLWIPNLLRRHVVYSDRILQHNCVLQIFSHLMCYKYTLNVFTFCGLFHIKCGLIKIWTLTYRCWGFVCKPVRSSEEKWSVSPSCP